MLTSPMSVDHTNGTNRGKPGFQEPSNTALILVRVFGHLLLAALVINIPALGEDRYLLAGFLLFIAAPCVCWIGFRFKEPQYCWIDPLCDLSLIILAAWWLPVIWSGALCLGVMVALSPSVSLHPRSTRIYLAYGLWLLIGMGLVLLFRSPSELARVPDGWTLLAIAVIYPTLIVYANWQRQRALVLMEQAHLLTAVNDVSGSVAHDFNNVLMAIRGHAELARLKLPEDHSVQMSLAEVVDGTSRASLLCGQLLAFTDKGKPDLTHLNLVLELHTLVGLMRPTLPPGVRIDVAPFAGQPLIYGERSEIQQVLLNVIVNAGEAMSEQGGTISISIAESQASNVKQVVVTVADEGQGIPDEVMRRIFDPFFTTKDRGHGLGLASVKRIMQSHSGEIVIDSKLGGGTRVSLRWPIVKS